MPGCVTSFSPFTQSSLNVNMVSVVMLPKVRKMSNKSCFAFALYLWLAAIRLRGLRMMHRFGQIESKQRFEPLLTHAYKYPAHTHTHGHTHTCAHDSLYITLQQHQLLVNDNLYIACIECIKRISLRSFNFPQKYSLGKNKQQEITN